MEELSELDLFHQCYGGIPDGICIFRADESGKIVFANKAALKLYACESEKEFFSLTGGRIEGLTFKGDISLPDDASVNGRAFRFTYITAQKHMRSADGVFIGMQIRGVQYFLLHIANPQAALREQDTDELTGLPSAATFYQQALNQARERSANNSFVFYCPVFFNIANFRGFNRTYGMDVGDRCLRFTASQLKRVFPNSPLTRLDADSFLGLLPRENLEEKIEEVCSAVNQYLENRSYAMKAGIVKFDEAVPAEVIRHSFDMARIACDSVKNDGEHSYAVFRKELGEQVEIRNYILDHFEQALEKGYIKAYFQPVVRTLSGKVCSAEALCRWEDPVKGMISPGTFIPVLEDARRIGRLDQYMIEQTVRTIYDLLASGRRVVPMSLNLSQLDFDLIQPLKCLNDTCEKYQVPHKYIHVEITERVLAESQERMIKAIHDFHEAGYEVWLDDFGSEYSSLKSLNRFSLDLIKLDMDFFRKFDDRSKAIITSIVIMAKRLGIHTLAEGVETKEHLDFLKEIGCERIQGFYYSAPAPRLDIEDILIKKHLQLESSLEASVYDKAGLEDIVDNDPVSLFLYENGAIRILTCNKAFWEELESVRVSVRITRNGTLQLKNKAAYSRIIQYLELVFSGDQNPYVFLDNGGYIRLNASFVSGVRDFWIGRVGFINLSTDNQLANKSKHEQLLHQSELLFDGIYYLNREKDEIQVVQCIHPKVAVDEIFHGISSSSIFFCHEFVHLDDQERFLKFMDVGQLATSLASSLSGYVKGIFRVRREDGNYRWTIFSTVDAGDADRHNFLVFEHAAYFEDENAKYLLPAYVTSLQPSLQIAGDQDTYRRYMMGEAIGRPFIVFRAFLYS
ncbi:MAG: GGDEF domain-containing phosphodiesterase [Eubacterium sp.]|nr:GGDEF domain-containing phosphodiesterase [Eubacterium sp.]